MSYYDMICQLCHWISLGPRIPRFFYLFVIFKQKNHNILAFEWSPSLYHGFLLSKGTEFPVLGCSFIRFNVAGKNGSQT